MVFRSGVGTQMLMVSSSRDDGKVGRRLQTAGRQKRRHVRRWHVRNVGRARVDGGDLALVEVDADDVKPAARELDGERQAHIPEADDAGGGGGGG